MNIFPTNYVILEGPDLSGKTTFYNALHKETGYKWNIHDRSFVSMIIHADQYKRDNVQHSHNFQMELMNLNNRFVIMLPPFEDVVLRYSIRGDEIQSLDDIRVLYQNFKAVADMLESYPNVMILKASDLDFNVHMVKHQLSAIETGSLEMIAEFVKTFSSNTKRLEATPLTFTLYDDGSFDQADPLCMKVESEKEYYREIYTGILTKIRKELRGENEYSRVESIESRRFIYTNDSCISLVHASYREDVLDIHFVLRSSEVSTTFHHDLKFLYFLTSCVYKELQLIPGEVDVRMRFNLNSAHILV